MLLWTNPKTWRTTKLELILSYFFFHFFVQFSELISSSTPSSVQEVATPPCLPNVGPPKILQVTIIASLPFFFNKEGILPKFCHFPLIPSLYFLDGSWFYFSFSFYHLESFQNTKTLLTVDWQTVQSLFLDFIHQIKILLNIRRNGAHFRIGCQSSFCYWSRCLLSIQMESVCVALFSFFPI